MTIGKIIIAFTSYYDSIGNAFYTEITKYLRLKPWDHESKVMGLAPYGKSEYCLDKMRKMIKINPSKELQFKNTLEFQPLLDMYSNYVHPTFW